MNPLLAGMLAQHKRAVQKQKQYTAKQARAAQVNNTGVGRVTAMTNDSRYTVEIDGGRTMMLYATTGTYNVGDIVSIRYLSKDKRQAEIAGKTTRQMTTNIKRVSR